jgi:hypothetical protein
MKVILHSEHNKCVRITFVECLSQHLFLIDVLASLDRFQVLF